MKATEGLYPYERLLAACGLVLFASLIWIIILRVKRRESIKVELLGFVVPIVMIGFPAIKKIQYEDGKPTIDKQVRLLERNPENHEARAELEETLANVEKRAGLDDQGHADIDDFDPDTVLYVADGKKALGDYAFAFEQAGFVLEADPEIEKAAQIRNEAADLLITDQLANPTHQYIGSVVQ